MQISECIQDNLRFSTDDILHLKQACHGNICGLRLKQKYFVDGIRDLMDCQTNCNEKLGAYVENKMS
jgi:hypothetical protein